MLVTGGPIHCSLAARDPGTYPVVQLHSRAVGHRQQILDPSAALVIVTVVMSFAPVSGPMGQSPVVAARSLLSLDGTPVSCQASDTQLSGYLLSGGACCRRGEQPLARAAGLALGLRASCLPGLAAIWQFVAMLVAPFEHIVTQQVKPLARSALR